MEKPVGSSLQNLSISYECALAIGNSLNLSEMLHEVIHTMVHKTNAHRGIIWVKNGEKKLQPVASAGINIEDVLAQGEIMDIRDVFNQIQKRQRCVLRYKDDKDFLQYCPVLTEKEESVLIVPVTNVAILHLVYASREIADEPLSNLLASLSKKLSVAIEACTAHENIINEVQVRVEAEEELKKKTEKLISSEKELKRLYGESEQARKSLLSILEDVAQKEEALRESEERFRTIFNSINDAVSIHDVETGAILDVNRTMCEMYGYSREEVDQLDIQTLSSGEVPYTQQDALEWNKKAVSGKPQVFEWMAKHKSGHLFWVEISMKKAVVGLQERLLMVVRDITERKQAEEALKLSNENFQQVVSNITTVVWKADIANDGTFKNTYTSPVVDELLGLPAGTLQSDWDKYFRYIKPEYLEQVNNAFREAINSPRNSLDCEYEVLKDNGQTAWFHSKGRCFEKNGKLHLFGSTTDITERKQAEEKEEEHHKNIELLSETAMQLVELPLDIDIYGFIGEKLHEFIGKDSYIIVSSVDEKQEVSTIRAVLGVGKFIDKTTKLLGKHPVGMTVNIKSEDMYIMSDCKLHSYTEGLYGLLVHTIPKTVCLSIEKLMKIDKIYTVDFTKEEQLLGTAVVFLREGAEEIKNLEIIETFIKQVSIVVQRRQAEKEKEKLQAQLNQAQKMESVGRLAGGVAHDFNNMLGVILGHAELAMDQVDRAQPLFSCLQDIRTAAERSANLTRQLLAFARKQTIAPRVLDLNETVESMLKMLRRLIGEDINLAWLPGTGIWQVRMDPSQIDQVLANLCVNARDAITDVGKVIIETGNATFDETYCTDHPGSVPGEYVLLAVSDDGCGMDKETLDKLFEPFFTTKEAGTGLGLATVYGVVKQNNGFINVYSEPDHGTIFKLYLPRHTGEAAQVQEEGPAEPIDRGNETILLVEDEPALLKLTTMMLESQGYIVLPASRPGEAIRLAGEYTGIIHLLVTDVVMPEMNGRDLAKNLLSVHPDLNCLFMSGYTANVIAHRGVLDEGLNFIRKPFAIKDLAAKVREALDSE